MSIIFLSMSFSTLDEEKKKKNRKISFYFFIPIIITFLLTALWGIIGVYNNLTGKVPVPVSGENKVLSNIVTQLETDKDAPFSITFPTSKKIDSSVSTEAILGCKLTTYAQEGATSSEYYFFNSAKCDSATSTLDSSDPKDLTVYVGSVNKNLNVTMATTTVIAGFPAFWVFGTSPDGTIGERYLITFSNTKGNYVYTLGAQAPLGHPEVISSFVNSFTIPQ